MGPVASCPIAVPRPEHGLDGSLELIIWILGHDVDADDLAVRRDETVPAGGDERRVTRERNEALLLWLR